MVFITQNFVKICIRRVRRQLHQLPTVLHIFKSGDLANFFKKVPVFTKPFLHRVRTTSDATAIRPVSLIEAIANHHKQQLKHCIFYSSSDMVLCALEAEQIRQVIRASLVFKLYVKQMFRFANICSRCFRTAAFH